MRGREFLIKDRIGAPDELYKHNRQIYGEHHYKRPDIIYHDGKPSAVIIGIDEYEELLEQIEDVDDIAYLKELHKKPMKFTSLEDLLKDRPVGV